MANIKVTKEIVTEVINKAGDLVKKATEKDSKLKLKKAEELLTTPKEKIKVGDKNVNVAKDAESVVTINKKDFKVKKPTVSRADADEALFAYNANKVTPKILTDFNINKIKTEKDILALIEQVSKKYTKDIKDRTRGIQDHRQTKKLADILQKDPKNLTKTLLNLRPGSTLNAEYMLAARELLAAGMVKLDGLAIAANKVDASDALKLEFRQHYALMSEFQKVIKGVQTETARTLQSFRIPTRSKNFANVNLDELNKKDLIVELGGADNIKQLATLYLKTGNEQAKLQFVEKSGGFLKLDKVSDSIAEVFINSILSAPMTHVRNTAGNFVARAIINTEHKMMSKMFGDVKGSGVAPFEEVARAYGQMMANQEMMQALSQTLKKGDWQNIYKNIDNILPSQFSGSKVELTGQKFTAENFGIKNKTAADTVDILGRILTLDRLPTKMLKVGDNYFKNGAYRAEIHTRAYLEAYENFKNRTLKYDDMPAFIAERVINPTKETTEAAFAAAKYTTFQTKAGDRADALGSLAKFAQNMKQTGGGYFTWLTNYYIPFTQTPINITGFVAERTPVLAQILTGYNKKIAAGGREAAMAKAKMALGYRFYMAAISLGWGSTKFNEFGQPIIAGADLKIPARNKQNIQSELGLQPNEFRVPDGKGGFHLLSLSSIDPVTTMFAQAANTAQYVDLMWNETGMKNMFANTSEYKQMFGQGDGIDKSQMAENAALLTMAYIYSFGENLTNSTYLKGASDFFNDAQYAGKVLSGEMEGTKFAKRWVNRFATGFVPNVLKTKASPLKSDYKKITKEFNVAVQSTLSDKSLDTQFNIFGKPKKKWRPTLNYGRTNWEAPEKEVFRVMPNLSRAKNSFTVSIGKFNDMRTNVQMTAEEQSFFQEKSGLLFNDKMNFLLNDDTYKNLDIAIQKGIIAKELGNARATVKKFMKEDENSPYAASINERGSEIILNQLKQSNEGDPFKMEELQQYEKQVEKQTE